MVIKQIVWHALSVYVLAMFLAAGIFATVTSIPLDLFYPAWMAMGVVLDVAVRIKKRKHFSNI